AGAVQRPDLDDPDDASELRRLRAEARRSGEGRIDLGWENSRYSGWGWLSPWHFLLVRSNGVVRYELYYPAYGGDALVVCPDGLLVQGLENRAITDSEGTVGGPFRVVDLNGDGWPDLGEAGVVGYGVLWEFDPRDQLFHELEGFGEAAGVRVDPDRP